MRVHGEKAPTPMPIKNHGKMVKRLKEQGSLSNRFSTVILSFLNMRGFRHEAGGWLPSRITAPSKQWHGQNNQLFDHHQGGIFSPQNRPKMH